MTQTRAGWRRNPFIVGPLIGWLTGMLWWAGLTIAFGPSTLVTMEGGQTVETPISVLSSMRYAPLVAVPWAVVGLIVGGFTALARTRWVPITSGVGLIGGATASLISSEFDGWLSMTMPLCCLGGALTGALIGSAGIAFDQPHADG